MCWLKINKTKCFYCKDTIIYEDKDDNHKIQCNHCNVKIHNNCYEKHKDGSLLYSVCPYCKKLGTICTPL